MLGHENAIFLELHMYEFMSNCETSFLVKGATEYD